jgi:hypothetical protein
MNKFLVYALVAIMLGVVTMVAPLAVLEPNNNAIFTDGPIKTTIQESERGTFGGNDMLSPQSPGEPTSDYAPESAPPPTPEPSETTPALPEESEFRVSTSDESLTVSGLSSLGVMIVPSFLVALGLFVVLKKRMN